MYEFYYNSLKPYWKDKMQLHYMDTDSFILSFDCTFDELINFLQKNKDEFDFSELDKNHELYDPINKKSCRKNENWNITCKLILDTFTALRSKSYCFSHEKYRKRKTKRNTKNSWKWRFYNSLFLSKTTNATNYSINLIIINYQ